MSGRRYMADRFDGDGTFFVFDREDAGFECAGPFDTFEEAEAKERVLNSLARVDLAASTVRNTFRGKEVSQ